MFSFFVWKKLGVFYCWVFADVVVDLADVIVVFVVILVVIVVVLIDVAVVLLVVPNLFQFAGIGVQDDDPPFRTSKFQALWDQRRVSHECKPIISLICGASSHLLLRIRHSHRNLCFLPTQIF